MNLYFLRHATAVDIASSDAARALTPHGEEEARLAGRTLKTLKVKPDRVLTSPLIRAEQTAQLAAAELGCSCEVEPIEELLNEATTPDVLRAVRRYPDATDLVLVGHMPSLADHLAVLVGAENPAGLGFGKGAVACVDLHRLQAGDGVLRWMLRQGQMRHLVK